MKKEELENKLAHAEAILKLFQTFDFRQALIETRIYFGEIHSKQSTLNKEDLCLE